MVLRPRRIAWAPWPRWTCVPWTSFAGRLGLIMAVPQLKRIRAATRMSQPVFARLLGVDKFSVAQWDRGAKRPSGPALRLLDPGKRDSPIVQVRRCIDGRAA